MPNTGGQTYDTATQTFRPAGSKPLPLPKLKNRKPRPQFDAGTKPANPYVPTPSAPQGPKVRYPAGAVHD